MNGRLALRTGFFCVGLIWLTSADAQLLKIRAGSESSIGPSVSTPCFESAVVRAGRALTQATTACVIEGSAIRAETFVTSGPGILPVDASAEVKIIVAHFQVDTPENAEATGYLPISIRVPVSWAGRFLNGAVFPAAIASQNMAVRLRETSAFDPNVAGPLMSESYFQGASHGGVRSCISAPKGLVSAATTLVGCALNATEKEEGSIVVEMSAVIRTNQPYSIELVSRGDLTATLVVDPINGYIPERVNFKEGFGLTWAEPATIAIGTDPHRVVADLSEEVDRLREELDRLRTDFDGRTHSYLTGRGAGHNDSAAETPPPNLAGTVSAKLMASSKLSQSGSEISDADGDETGKETWIAASANGGGGGAFGLLSSLALVVILLNRRSRRRFAGEA